MPKRLPSQQQVVHLNKIFTNLQIPSLLCSNNRFQRLEKFDLKQNRSVLVDFITALTRDSDLYRSIYLASSACHGCIVLGKLKLSMYCLKSLKTVMFGLCQLAILLTVTTHRLAKSLVNLPSLSQELSSAAANPCTMV